MGLFRSTKPQPQPAPAETDTCRWCDGYGKRRPNTMAVCEYCCGRGVVVVGKEPEGYWNPLPPR